MPRNTMTLKDLENFLSVRRSAPSAKPKRIASPPVHLPSVSFAEGGPVGTQYPRIGGGLDKAQGALRRAEEERQFKKSVLNQPHEERWQPEYEKEPALEAPMISPDDLFGTGIPTKIAMALKGAAPMLAGLGVIKNKGGNWLTGSVEDALGGLKRQGRHIEGMQPANPGALARLRAGGEKGIISNEALNSFIDKQLTRYVKNEMATPEDPIRALAERGVLHYDPSNEISGGTLSKAALNRGRTGNVSSGIGESQLAKQWETLSDAGLGAAPASEWKANASPEVLSRMPWLGKLSDEALIFEKQNPNLSGSLGFTHLTDELANAMNPESGLPRHLLLDPKSMDRVSVPQAVERVAQINAWRAAQKAELDAAKANNAATHLHKEYPDKGFKWVELKAPEAAKDFDASRYIVKDGPHGGRGVFDTVQNHWFVPPTTSEMPDQALMQHAIDSATKDQRKQLLQDALKYEGDTMGHCVGGYCDDVASGRTKIYSLRDAKGQPHVTVEVAPPQGFAGKKSREEYEAFLRGHETPHSEEEIAQALQDLDKGGAWSPRIQQIKGKQNRAPNEEYLPFVQDFVKSGKWSDVGDLHNTGLRRSRDIWNDLEQQKIREAGHIFGEYVSPEEKKTIVDAVWPDQWGEYAHGGSVELNNATRGSVKNNLSVQQLSAIIASLRQGHLNG